MTYGNDSAAGYIKNDKRKREQEEELETLDSWLKT